MKLIMQSDDVDVEASLIKHVDDVAWFVAALGMKLVSKADTLPAALRAAGVKHMRFTKAEENAFGAFVRGETYTDGLFKHHFLIFENHAAALASDDATNSTILAYLQHVGLSEQKFEERPTYFLELLGYLPDPEQVTLEVAGIQNSVKGMYGKPKDVRHYRLGDRVLGVARFKATTYIHFGNEQQLQDIYRELGIIFTRNRLERRVRELLGGRNGTLNVVLLNQASIRMTVNQDAPDWAGSLHQMCEQTGGGAILIMC